MHPLTQCFLCSDHNDLMSRKKQAHDLSAGMHFLGPCAKSTRYLLSVIREAASAYASRSMSDTEMRYAQIEEEALAITWACEQFSNYLIGTKFKLETANAGLLFLYL
jgi:hypothetical protein